MEPLNILVIGTGMYTCGTGTETYGTVMPAVFEWKRKNSAGGIYLTVAKRTRANRPSRLRKAVVLRI